MTLLNDVVQHERAFQDFLRAVSRGDNETAVDLARTLLTGLSGTMKSIQSTYAESLVQAQMPTFRKDLERLQTGSSAGTRELASMARRLERYLAVVEREVQRLRKPEPSVWRQFFIRWSSQIKIGGASILGAAVLILVAHMVLSRGHGLVGEYFSDTGLEDSYRRRVDSTVDFVWGRKSPFRGWRRDRFSIRWTGYIVAPTAGRYGFFVHVDDGVRLFVDDQNVIDDWNVRKVHVVHGVCMLDQGYHRIRVEYFEQAKDAVIRLFWQRPNGPRPELISSRYFFRSARFLKDGVPVYGSTDTVASPDKETSSDGEDIASESVQPDASSENQ